MLFQILGKQGFVAKRAHFETPTQGILAELHRQNNKHPKQFVWTKGPEKLQRIIEATKEYQAAHPRKLRKRRRKVHSIKINCTMY